MNMLYRLLYNLPTRLLLRCQHRFILSFLLTTVCHTVFAQAPSIEWQKYLGKTSDDYAYAIQQTSDGGYIIVGQTYSTDGDVLGNYGNGDFGVIKLDSKGQLQWQKSLGGLNYDSGYSIQQTADGGYIVAGLTKSIDGDVSGNHGGDDIWVVKLNNQGRVQWQKCLGGSGNDYASSIQQTSDGGYIVAGQTYSADGDVLGYHGAGDMWVAKLSSQGQLEWQKCLGGSNIDFAKSIQQTVDGSYIIAGSTSSNNNDVSGNHGSSDFWVVKLNSQGQLQWQKCLGGSDGESASSIQQTLDGGYIITGGTSSNNNDVSGNEGSSDFWVVKLNGQGQLQWQKCLGGSNIDFASSIQQTSDGGYVVAGQTYSTDGDVSGGHGGSDMWILKLNSQGVLQLQWQKTLGGSSFDSASSIQQTSDGGYIVAGITKSFDGTVSGNNGNGGFWVVKLQGSIQTEHYHQLLQNGLFDTRQLLTKNNTAKICADGSSASIFKFYGGGFNFTDVGVRTPTDAAFSPLPSSFTVIAQNADSLVVRYQHPNFVALNAAAYASSQLLLYQKSSPTTIVFTVNLQIYAPPFLMIHGLNSDNSIYVNMEDSLRSTGNYAANQLYRVDYAATSRASFATNKDVVSKAINKAIINLQADKIACGKVDIVGHSMGGILTRLYLQSLNYYQDIHKLITLNTPHSGSQMANQLLQPSLVPDLLNIIKPAVLAGGWLFCKCGAFYDLEVNSPAIDKQLNGNLANQPKVPTHAITTIQEVAIESSLFGHITLKPLEFITLGTTLTGLFGEPTHDLIVSLTSQKGGVEETKNAISYISDQWHGSTKNPAVIAKVKTLLVSDPTSNDFTIKGFNPKDLNYPTPSASNGPAIALANVNSQTLTIQSPISGTTVFSGESLNVTVSGSSGIAKVEVYATYSPDSIYIGKQTGSQLAQSFSVDTKEGRKSLVAVGYDAAGTIVGTDSVYFYVYNSVKPPTISGSLSVCAGTSLLLTVNCPVIGSKPYSTTDSYGRLSTTGPNNSTLPVGTSLFTLSGDAPAGVYSYQVSCVFSPTRVSVPVMLTLVVNSQTTTVSNQTITAGQSVTLTPGCSLSSTAQWSDGVFAITRVFSPTSSTTYSAICPTPNGTCPSQFIYRVTVSNPTGSTLASPIATGNRTTCVGNTLSVTVVCPTTGSQAYYNGIDYTYGALYSTGPNNTPLPTGTALFILSGNAPPGVYTYQLLCGVAPPPFSSPVVLSLTVTSSSSPVVNSQTISAGQSVTLSPSCLGSVSWNDGVTTASRVFSPTLTTSYTAICSSTSGLCPQTFVYQLVVNGCSSMYSVKNGNWDDSTVWSCGRAPTSLDAVEVRHTVTILSNYIATVAKVKFLQTGRINYASGGKLRLMP